MSVGLCGWHNKPICPKCNACVDCGKNRCKCYDYVKGKKEQELMLLFSAIKKELKRRGWEYPKPINIIMTVKSHIRGNETKFDEKKGEWVWADTKESVSKERSCVRCGKMPTKEGHDYCLGNIPGIKSACCGHGVEKGYKIKQ